MGESDAARTELLRAKQRWALVNARAEKEARRATIEEKLDEIERLMLSIDDFGWRAALDDDACVRDRWNRLQKRLGRIEAAESKE
jgi:hypothetical protein